MSLRYDLFPLPGQEGGGGLVERVFSTGLGHKADRNADGRVQQRRTGPEQRRPGRAGAGRSPAEAGPRSTPGAVEHGHAGWGNVAYEAKGVFCYIAPLKDSVNLGFHRGVELRDPHGLLEGNGKSMRHLKIRSIDEIDMDAVGALVRQAAELGRS